MGHYYYHLRYTFKVQKRKPSSGLSFCDYFGISLLYLVPILSLFAKFEGGWNRAFRGFIFSIRLHALLAFLCIVRISYSNDNFSLLFGIASSLFFVPTSLWKVLFIPKYGNQKGGGKKITLGLIRILPVL